MNRIPSVMTHAFSQVPKVSIPRSSFNRSHGYKTTFDAGYLVPFYVDEALPGDSFNVKLTALARLATPLKPLMDNLYLDTFFFSVPYRLVWSNFQKFCGEQINPGDSTSYTVPQMVSTAGTGYLVGSLHDYFGLPLAVAGYTHSALWHRAYNLIWREWFRDQNLQNSPVVDTGDAASLPANYTLLRRGKRHDYFTSCLPWPQKGTAVQLPLGTEARVATGATAGTNVSVYSTLASGFRLLDSDLGNVDLSATAAASPEMLYADLSTATAATINQLRQAFQIQRLYERDARGGTRYREILASHFGVTSDDARLQRPEYLGGGSQPVVVNPVAVTNDTIAVGGTAYPGKLGAFGITTVRGNGFTKSFTEHCLLIGLMSVRADLTYQRGLNRMFSRSTRWDFYWPALANIGEQAVLNKEIYLDGSGNDANVFGYQERFGEYRYKPSEITGKMRSVAAGTLDIWHLSQAFTALPTLGDTFIQENPPIARVSVVNTEPHFIFDSFLSMKCARPMPVYGVPGQIDHF